MDSKIQKHLEQAKAYFYAWRLSEAYTVLKRFFDRLPFEVQPEHAEYIGMFVRTLCELGKQRDLIFYVGELEKWREKENLPHITYSLAFAYYSLPDRRLKRAEELFESLVRGQCPEEIRTKARLMLAKLYSMRDDIAACRRLIDAIVPSADPKLEVLVKIWAANVFRLEGNQIAAKAEIKKVLTATRIEDDWYAHFSASLVLAGILAEENKFVEAIKLLSELKTRFHKTGFRSVQKQIESGEALLKSRMVQLDAELWLHKQGAALVMGSQEWRLDRKKVRENVLLTLLENRFLSKSKMIQLIYGREYVPQKDDKLVYYHAHSMRKDLVRYGISADALTHKDGGYELNIDVKITRRARDQKVVA